LFDNGNKEIAMPGGTFEVFQRADRKWAWRLKAANGYIVATDGGQGYDNRADADAQGRKVVNGGYGPV
jgi:uncharacterized protein YegP (UPF0339 family)